MIYLKREEEVKTMLVNIEKCTTARLATIWELAQEGVTWAKNNKQLKEITKELEKRGVLENIINRLEQLEQVSHVNYIKCKGELVN